MDHMLFLKMMLQLLLQISLVVSVVVFVANGYSNIILHHLLCQSDGCSGQDRFTLNHSSMQLRRKKRKRIKGRTSISVQGDNCIMFDTQCMIRKT